MACCRYRPVMSLLRIFVGALIYGFIPLVKFIVDILCKGPTRIFCHRSRNVRPEVLKNSEFGTHEFYRLPNTRLKLHCVVGGQSGKPLMLFLHGFPEFWYSWRYQLKEFCKDYRTVAVDMRGYGDSDKPTGICEYTRDKLVDDVHQLITELGYEKCVLVGHDWGGSVAWCYAALYPERVERLIECNMPHPAAFEKHIKSSSSQRQKLWHVMFFQWPVLPEMIMLSDDSTRLETALFEHAKHGTFSLEDVEAFKYTFATYGDWNGPINYYRAVVRYVTPEVDTALRQKIVVPTLLIWGSKDSVLEQKAAEMSSQCVEDSTVKFIESGHHFVQQDEPQQVNLLMRQFLGT